MTVTERHHTAPQCLLCLWDRANGSLPDADISEAWLEFTLEAERWRVPVEISRPELEWLVRHSEVELEREKHRLLHSNDFARWGARGGRETARRYGREHFSLLGRIRHGDVEARRVLAARMARRREVAA